MSSTNGNLTNPKIPGAKRLLKENYTVTLKFFFGVTLPTIELGLLRVSVEEGSESGAEGRAGFHLS